MIGFPGRRQQRGAPDVYRLAVVTGARYWGGAEVFLTYLLAGLPGGVVVTVVGPDPAVIARVAAARAGTAAVVVPMRVRTMAAALRAAAPDVVHVNLPALTECRQAIVAAVALRLPVVLVDHLPVPGLTWKGRTVQRAMTRLVAARVAVAERAARDVERYAGLAPGAVTTIRNGVPAPAARRRSRDEGRLVVGLLGALEPRKGVDVLLRALPAAPQVWARLAGDGPQRAGLEGLASHLGVAARVEFLGRTDDPAAFLGSVDALVLPSRQEALPLVVLEAMHVGLPVVAADIGSVAEVVEDGVTGLVVPLEDPAALAAALRRVAEDPREAGAWGDTAARRAAAEHTHGVMAGRYDGLYRRVAR